MGFNGKCNISWLLRCDIIYLRAIHSASGQRAPFFSVLTVHQSEWGFHFSLQEALTRSVWPALTRSVWPPAPAAPPAPRPDAWECLGPDDFATRRHPAPRPASWRRFHGEDLIHGDDWRGLHGEDSAISRRGFDSRRPIRRPACGLRPPGTPPSWRFWRGFAARFNKVPRQERIRRMPVEDLIVL